MKSQKTLLVAAFSAIAVFCTVCLLSFKTKTTRPCEVTIQFSPTTSNFSAVSVDNCNSVQSTGSVTAGTSWIPILNGTGCTTLGITTSLPTLHPAGTINIYKNGGGTPIISHVLSANQHAVFDDIVKAECDDYFTVTW